MKTSRAVLPLLLIAVLLSTSAAGMTARPVTLAEQVDQSDLIFVGTVVSVESVPVRDGSFAFTYVTFDVQETLKGAAAGRVLTLRLPGGEAAPWVYEIPGLPRFRTGGKHLLFVSGNDRDLVPLVGVHQGKLDIVAHPVTQEPVLVDHERRAVEGVRDSGWSRGRLQFDGRGQIRSRQAGARVVSEAGVKIDLGEDEQPANDAAPATRALEQLRALIRHRSFGGDFQRGEAVASASPSNVPATTPFGPPRAAREK